MKHEHFKNITDYHKFRNLKGPSHPLVSVIHIPEIEHLNVDEPDKITQDFYMIALKTSVNARMRYGQTEYDFNEGKLMFVAPRQVYAVQATGQLSHKGWLLLMHPDFLWNTSLAEKINGYDYFDYAVNEAIFLSDKEKTNIEKILQNIDEECKNHTDIFSKSVIITQIELLLNYAQRFYHRQFITREKENHKILTRFEKILSQKFDGDEAFSNGVPTVRSISESLHLSSGYLSAMLKVLTGKTAQQHIHDKLIEKAKQRLSLPEASISEIAFELGFEYSQSFSKLFKTKTGITPSEFRKSFN
ncbi:helix-turn-helix transcriptional regulator [Aquimarina sp. U1-2]|uniref:helix-turn-helix domain-containing protein n=1 Tax=Aquimarina sp. U1-2 TaxID=2823141 RepID=UPI001AEC869F|nr:response regulator transcription factor [Aquimarina sp. U1-2]MBP2833449.1 helix-turn-helix transcriptional regulator [Aquimarina sp. U1-2]